MTIASSEQRIETLDATVVTPTPARWRGMVIDLVLVAALAVVAVLIRQHGLPTQGLWLVDAVEGAAVKAPLSQIITVSQDHPGYIVALKLWSHLFGGSDVSLGYPALLAGIFGPVLLYFTLRRLDYARSIGFLLSAALVVSQVDIAFSGRLKSYTTDLLVVLILVLAVQRLARIRWQWWTGVLWILMTFVFGSLSLFALIAAVVAGLTLLIHPASDLKIRGPAIGVQLVANAVLGVVVVESYNTQAVQAQWRQLWDAFLTFHANPFQFGSEVLQHLNRIAQVFPGGASWFTTLCALVAIVGLGITAWRGPRVVVARYLLLLLGVAFVGGLTGKVPFGPNQANVVEPGGRASMWLIPVIAVGLAAVLQRVRDSIPRRAIPIAFDAVVMVGAAVTLGFALEATPLYYPFPAPAQAVSFVESQLGQHDALLVDTPWYSLAAESHFTSVVLARPTLFPGFLVGFKDSRIHTVGDYPSVTEIDKDVVGAKKVLVYVDDRSIIPTEIDAQEMVDRSLTALGLQLTTFAFQDARVEVWEHSGTSSLPPPLVKVAMNPKYGPILVDNEGRTLYTLTNAATDKPIPCLGTCGNLWPPLLVPAGNKNVTGGPGVTGLGGAHIVTVQGYPLFRYSGDTAAGEANGNGIRSYGGVWYVIKVGVNPGAPVTG